MRQVIGIFPQNTYESGAAIPAATRVEFERRETSLGGYFDCISPFFDEMSQSQCLASVNSINVLLVLCAPELAEAIAITEKMKQRFSAFEQRWRYHQGSVKGPGKEEREIHLSLNRTRLLSVVAWLQNMFQNALQNGHCVVFGNGVCFRMLCGIKTPPGSEVYS